MPRGWQRCVGAARQIASGSATAGPKGVRGIKSVWLGRVGDRVERVVPLTVEGMAGEGAIVGEGLHRRVGNLYAGWVFGRVEFGVDGQPGAGRGRGDGLHDDFVTGERPSAPVHGDVGEEPVFDLVPLAGARR